MSRMNLSAVAAALNGVVFWSVICAYIAVAAPESSDDRFPISQNAAFVPEAAGAPNISTGSNEYSGQIAAADSETQAGPAPIHAPETTRQPAVGQTAFEGISDLDLFERIAVSLANLETMTARFVQTSPEGEVVEGRLFLDRPGFLKFAYEQPHPQVIIARDGTIFVHDVELETTLQYAVADTPLQFLLTDILSLDEVTMVALERAQNSVALTLEAKDAATEGQLSMIFTAPALQLTRWAVIDGRGGITLVDLSEIEENNTINADVFDTSTFEVD